MVIFLIGYMGSGKSHLGRALAKRRGWRFIDTDREIEHRQQMTIAEFFVKFGEAQFREEERKLLSEIATRYGKSETDKCDCTHEGAIVATGGGLPCYGDNVELMNSSGVTIYLKLTPQQLFVRLNKGRYRRPLIKQLDDRELMEFIEDNLMKREKYYEQASVTIDSYGVREEYVCERLAELFQMSEKRCEMGSGEPIK